MVSFTCQNCGDTLKEDIAQHVGECRGPFPLTCIHCSEEFYDDRYTSHTSCASERPEIPQVDSKSANDETDKQEPKLSSVVETKLSTKVETEPVGEVKPITTWIHVIDRESQSSNLTRQQSSFLQAFANVRNAPKERGAFEKFAPRHWKEYDAHKTVIDELFYWPQSATVQEPLWITALRNYKPPSNLPMQKKIHDKLLSYQKKNPVPLSLPSRRSLQNLVCRVYQDLSIDWQVANDLFDAIMMEIERANDRRETLETADTSAVAEEGTSKKKKKDRIKTAETAEILEEDLQSAQDEVPNKKSKKKKRKHQEEAILEENVPRKKSTKSA